MRRQHVGIWRQWALTAIDDRQGIISTKRLSGFAKYLSMELNQVDRRGAVTTWYTYKVPKELVAKALKAGGVKDERRRNV